jgi:hypothetical protein
MRPHTQKGYAVTDHRPARQIFAPLPWVVVEQPEVLQGAQKEKQQPSGTYQHTFHLPNLRGEVP